MSQQRLLVVGVGSELGSLTTALLEQDAQFSDILGIDVHPPRRRLRRTTFVRIEHDEQAGYVHQVVAHRPDVIVHLGVWEPHARLGTSDARIATGNYARALCDALTHLDGLSRLILRSGLEVYGAPLRQPADESALVSPTSTYGHMLVELETMLRSAAPRTATVTALRFAPVIGAHVPSPLGRLLRLPIINEEQLDLYTIEQELDLLTPASEAAYVVLIDFTSPHSALISNEEQLQIKRTYRTLANSVANIYEGEVSALGEDILIQFDNASEDDEHGVNAACAAMLFAQLARSYNRSRSEQQEPVLNVHTAIVRGQQGRQDRMADEARFLTRSTKTDRLISHTALSEAPDLKSGVLSTAEIKREDEDKVLILSLSKSYQDLLEKQGRYLLAKLAQQAAQ